MRGFDISKFWKKLFRRPPDLVLEYEVRRRYNDTIKTLKKSTSYDQTFTIETDDKALVIRVWRIEKRLTT